MQHGKRIRKMVTRVNICVAFWRNHMSWWTSVLPIRHQNFHSQPLSYGSLSFALIASSIYSESTELPFFVHHLYSKCVNEKRSLSLAIAYVIRTKVQNLKKTNTEIDVCKILAKNSVDLKLWSCLVKMNGVNSKSFN